MNIVTNEITFRSTLLSSLHLNREVRIDCRYSRNLVPGAEPWLLLLNDGQMLAEAGFPALLEKYAYKTRQPVFTIGIHAGKERLMEYGTAGLPDYLGRGAKSEDYGRFVMEELLPWVRMHYRIASFSKKVFAGFSMGGLSALDIVLNHPCEFSTVAVFSGSLWWRSLAFDDPEYSDAHHRIIHAKVRRGGYFPWLRFFFECGTEDETSDRNNNGIIDSIDDTMDLMEELRKKGYKDKQMKYLEIKGGKHDAQTWGRGLKEMLKWEG